MKKLLISAFDPFGGEERNASLEALQSLMAPPDTELKKIILPTVFGLAGERMLAALREENPDAVICLGQAAGRAVITPERVAINIRDASIPDNAGFLPKDEPIVPGAPAAFFSTLPIRKMTEAALHVGIPAAVSNSAGTFVCNDLMYTLLYALSQEELPIICGFIHVPLCVPRDNAPGIPYLPLKDIVRGLDAMLSVI